MISVVIDTNVFVSAVITPFGYPAMTLAAVFNGDIELLFDDRIMAEYRDVLKRKKFGIEPHLVDEVLDYIVSVGTHITASHLDIRLKDHSDLPFIEVAVAGGADALVTGNTKHFPNRVDGTKIISPKSFVNNYL